MIFFPPQAVRHGVGTFDARRQVLFCGLKSVLKNRKISHDSFTFGVVAVMATKTNACWDARVSHRALRFDPICHALMSRAQSVIGHPRDV
eukprot:474684-Amorphochlora_amoeboformis.AAC.2